MTELEAQKKQCPCVQYCENAGASYDAHFAIMSQSSCIGRECMGWRWADYEGHQGYCGMAGEL